MSRQKLSEYRAKKLFNPQYTGLQTGIDSITSDVKGLSSNQKYILKVDQGIKKRGKQGLLKGNLAKNQVPDSLKELAQKGFTRFLVEEMVPHQSTDEQYLSFERVRDGIAIHYSSHGGIDVEGATESVQSAIYPKNPSPFPQHIIAHFIGVMDQHHLSFVEFNPVVWHNNQLLLLDAAVLVDSAGQSMAGWSSQDIIESTVSSPAERAIQKLNANSTASFSLKLINPQGSLWLLLSGGGASITIADHIHAQGYSDQIANYGEYSGGPTTEESYLYTKELATSLLQSSASKKALIIAGGVANFTDIKQTFTGVIKALAEVAPDLKKSQVKVFVRRGGPNEQSGLLDMETFLKQYQLYGSVEGSAASVTSPVQHAITYIS